ncbi:MAG: radical SAM protein, partial [Niameybacter sp.]
KEEINEDQILKFKYIVEINNNNLLTLIIVLTEDCNLRCKYCYEDRTHETISTSVQENIVKFIKKNISKYRGLHISWYGGEPLLKVNVIEQMSEKIIDICSREGKIYSSSITTNAYLLNLEIFNRLLKSKVTYYQITIDGAEKTHDYQRTLANGMGSYKKIYKNLLDIKDNSNKRFNISIRTNYAKDTVEYMDEFVEGLIRNFGEDKRFNLFFRPVMNWGGALIDDFSEHLLDKEEFDKVYEKYGDEVSKQKNTHVTTSFYSSLAIGQGLCYGAKNNNFVIDCTGLVYKCTCEFMRNDKSRIGVLKSDGTMELDEYRQSLWVTTLELEGKCRKCFFSANCFTSSCNRSLALNKENQRQCPIEKDFLVETLEMLDKDGFYKYL